jgi:hypothetical protein
MVHRFALPIGIKLTCKDTPIVALLSLGHVMVLVVKPRCHLLQGLLELDHPMLCGVSNGNKDASSCSVFREHRPVRCRSPVKPQKDST